MANQVFLLIYHDGTKIKTQTGTRSQLIDFCRDRPEVVLKDYLVVTNARIVKPVGQARWRRDQD